MKVKHLTEIKITLKQTGVSKKGTFMKFEPIESDNVAGFSSQYIKADSELAKKDLIILSTMDKRGINLTYKQDKLSEKEKYMRFTQVESEHIADFGTLYIKIDSELAKKEKLVFGVVEE